MISGSCSRQTLLFRSLTGVPNLLSVPEACCGEAVVNPAALTQAFVDVHTLLRNTVKGAGAAVSVTAVAVAVLVVVVAAALGDSNGYI